MTKLVDKISGLKTRQKAINDRQAAIEAECDEKHGGAFTPELRTEYNALQAEFETNATELAQAEADLNAVNARRGRAPIDTAKPRKTDASVAGDIDVGAIGHDGAAHDPKVTFKLPTGIRTGGSLQNFRGEYGGRSAQERAYRYGQFVLARATLCLPGRYNFHSAVQFCNDQFGSDKMAVMSTSDGNGSHVLVPEEFGNDLIYLRERYGVARKLFKNVPMLSDTRTDPRRQTGLTAYFTSEGGAGTESDMTHDNVRLVAKELMVLGRMSNQLNMNAVVNLGDDVAGEVSQAFALKEDQCGFNGDGTSTYGGIAGARTLLNTGTKKGRKLQGTGNTWAALVRGDFSGVVGLLPEYADVEGEVCWVCHRTFFYDVMEPLVLAAGGVTANEVREGNRRPRPLFLGYPVEFSQVFPSTTAVDTVPVLLGNFKMGASFGDRQQETFMLSEHASVGGQSTFERNQIAFRGTESVDMNAHGVGTDTVAGPICGLRTGA